MVSVVDWCPDPWCWDLDERGTCGGEESVSWVSHNDFGSSVNSTMVHNQKV